MAYLMQWIRVGCGLAVASLAFALTWILILFALSLVGKIGDEMKKEKK